MSNLVLFIGHTGTGKTYAVKKAISATKKKAFIFDVNNEYTEHEREISGDFKTFMEKAISKTETNLVFEDATGYLNGKTAETMRKLIVAKRHTRNNIFMLFHSISSVPPFIFELSNWIILHKTADEPHKVKAKKDILYKPFVKLRGMQMIKNTKGKMYSPSIHIKNI